jgi:hypothetical protein
MATLVWSVLDDGGESWIVERGISIVSFGVEGRFATGSEFGLAEPLFQPDQRASFLISFIFDFIINFDYPTPAQAQSQLQTTQRSFTSDNYHVQYPWPRTPPTAVIQELPKSEAKACGRLDTGERDISQRQAIEHPPLDVINQDQAPWKSVLPTGQVGEASWQTMEKVEGSLYDLDDISY